MARFLLVLKPTGADSGAVPGKPATALLESLAPVLDALHAEVDHRTPVHLGALLKNGAENQRMQLFADVQSPADGRLLELVLISREAMGSSAPDTTRTFHQLMELVTTHLGDVVEVVFRSDRDGPCPPRRPSASS